MVDTDRLSRERWVSRRSVLRAGIGGTALTVSAGMASAHEFGSDGDSSTTAADGHDHADATLHGSSGNVEVVGYHSLGDVGPASQSGRPDSPLYGGITELRVHGDYAYVGIFSSNHPTGGRGLAILDISEFNDAKNPRELREAELSVTAFLRNDNPASAVMDVKVSDDGNYLFMSKQPLTAAFDEFEPAPSTEPGSTTAGAAALQAVDVSDPERPQVVGTYDLWGVGPHNSFTHRINETDYVFAVNGPSRGQGGIFVFAFDRVTGVLQPVNYWFTGETGNTFYYHDIYVQDDPKTGKPYGYLANWENGARILDLSDPMNIVELGAFTHDNSHYAQPAPTLLDGKRVFITSEENGSDEDGYSGFVYLVDADPIDEYDGEPVDLGTASANDDPSSEGDELDKWVYRTDTSFGQDSLLSTYLLSPHNSDITADGWISQAHYHGGVRFLKIDTGSWSLSEKGYFQAAKDVPEDSKMDGLNDAAPFTWAAVQHNGVTYVSDINTGVYALHHKPSSKGNQLTTAGSGVAAAGLAGLLYRYRDDLTSFLP